MRPGPPTPRTPPLPAAPSSPIPLRRPPARNATPPAAPPNRSLSRHDSLVPPPLPPPLSTYLDGGAHQSATVTPAIDRQSHRPSTATATATATATRRSTPSASPTRSATARLGGAAVPADREGAHPDPRAREGGGRKGAGPDTHGVRPPRPRRRRSATDGPRRPGHHGALPVDRPQRNADDPEDEDVRAAFTGQPSVVHAINPLTWNLSALGIVCTGRPPVTTPVPGMATMHGNDPVGAFAGALLIDMCASVRHARLGEAQSLRSLPEE